MILNLAVKAILSRTESSLGYCAITDFYSTKNLEITIITYLVAECDICTFNEFIKFS